MNEKNQIQNDDKIINTGEKYSCELIDLHQVTTHYKTESSIEQKKRIRLSKLLRPESNTDWYTGTYSSSDIEKLPWYDIVAIKRWSIFKIFIASLVLNFIIIAFITRAETIPSGVAGIPTLLMFIFPVLKPFYGLLFLISNMPLMIIFHKKIKPTFIILNWTYLITTVLWSSILNIEPILDWINRITDLAGSWSLETAQGNDNWPIVVYGLIGSLGTGVVYAILWQAGSSTAGTDIISYFYSVKYQKSIGSLLRLLSFSTVAVYFIIYAGIRWDSHNSIDVGLRNFLAIQLFTTAMIVLISSAVLNFFYPKYKKVNVEISTNKPEILVSFFNRINYWHSYRIETYKSGYTKLPTYQISTVMYFFESKSLIRDMQNFDPQIWVRVLDVKKTYGKFDSSYVD
ncbi:YitT family protein [Mycoplasmopsis agassizii]|uniref:YitT family protein n=1 Tax=Mycoplasmopsis agassizii TaxID=33922 RepID=A0ABX4H5Y5_9BACT|nr:YitT family protein [Mycoplasmopsis agassizii]PAF55305.1 YitT family protein [Mycoplasmopsis agassizii]SMC15741.1 Uncharacterized membrane-anchored protein YitT, contains DUF161 and DUF2179 domains [Mycoplasmopsis agassizii]